MDSLELQVDRGDGKGFVPLTFTTNTDYADNSPLPAAGTKRGLEIQGRLSPQ
ncbi:MAG TPA: hypothetical protein VMD27_13600 [Candidatus Aquilonibacter sp.]|nr:hypothetical protein [Candidatus Aquilonibacter sp.]